jgi:hypothetical protein
MLVRFGPFEFDMPRHYRGRPLDSVWTQLAAAMPKDWELSLDRVRDAAEATYKTRELSEDWSGWTAATPIPPWWEIAGEFATALIRVFGEQFSIHIQDARKFDDYIRFAVSVAIDEAWSMCVYGNEHRVLDGAGDELDARRVTFASYIMDLTEDSVRQFRLGAWQRVRDAQGRGAPGGTEVTESERIPAVPAPDKSRVVLTGRPNKKRGPKPDYEEGRRVRDAVRENCGENWEENWRRPGYVDAVADALDEVKAIRPRTWAGRQPPLRTWAGALEKEKPIFMKAVEARLELGARIAPDFRVEKDSTEDD